MDHSRFAIRLLADLPILSAIVGDRLLIRVGHPEPIILIRSLAPNYGAIVEAIARGDAFPADAGQQLGDITRQLVYADGTPPPPTPLPPLSQPGHQPRVLRFPHRV